jgi:hypothetical protein
MSGEACSKDLYTPTGDEAAITCGERRDEFNGSNPEFRSI